MSDPDETRLLVELSRDHYLAGRSKVEIAQDRGLSRFQVARLLERARALGVVRIEVAVPPHLDLPRARRLAARLGAAAVVVAESADDPAVTRENVARELAGVIGSRVVRGGCLGLAWSRTVEAAVGHLPALPSCDVVQLSGALPVAGGDHGYGIHYRFAAMPGVRTWPLLAPLVVGDATTAEALRGEPEIAAALRRAGDLDVAVVEVCPWSAQGADLYGRVPAADRDAAAAAGAVAECAGRLLDPDGRPVAAAFDARVLAAQVDQLVRTPEVIAAGQGAAAAPGLRAAVAGGLARILVMDDSAAAGLERLLEA
ncbi:sugar-binding domain-containing protein [Georgenia alba]|uniref:Sugar-binding domain-containing protein n=1 Tax=Georgenia alba TaxID=2233858 RepID=A0ABW2Q690_9MICO